MNNIHPTAIVSDKAKIGDNVTIHPFAIVQDDVVIGDNCSIGQNAVIYNGARLGNSVQIYQGASISNSPQDLKFDNEITYFYVGNNTVVREFATLHRGTHETGQSSVGSNCLIMAYAHIAHDCKIGNNVILANAVQVAGHSEIDDFTIIGGLSGVHQFCKIGRNVMFGGHFRTTKDVPPYILAGGTPLKFEGLNLVGLRRRGFSNDEINSIKDAYQIIYNSNLLINDAKQKLIDTYSENDKVMEIVRFIDRSNRGLIR